MQKNRLYALLVAVLMLCAPLVLSSRALSTDISPLGHLDAKASPPAGLPGDTAIQFFDPNFEAAVREIIGKPEGDITVSDVERITSLNVSGFDIVDLAGIEYFTALEELYCIRNQLTTLDMSHNTALTMLQTMWRGLPL